MTFGETLVKVVVPETEFKPLRNKGAMPAGDTEAASVTAVEPVQETVAMFETVVVVEVIAVAVTPKLPRATWADVDVRTVESLTADV